MGRLIYIAILLLLSGCVKKQEDVLYDDCKSRVPVEYKGYVVQAFSSIKETDIYQTIRDYPNDGVLRGKWTVTGHIVAENPVNDVRVIYYRCQYNQWKDEVKFSWFKLLNVD